MKQILLKDILEILRNNENVYLYESPNHSIGLFRVDNQTVIENGQAMKRGLRVGAGVIDPKIVESINQVGLPNVLSDDEIKDVSKNSR